MPSGRIFCLASTIFLSAGTLLTTTYLLTRQGLEKSVSDSILSYDAPKEKWEILTNKLKTTSNNDNLTDYFKEAKEGINDEKMKKLCVNFRRLNIRNWFYVDKRLEEDVKKYCILKMSDIVEGNMNSTDEEWSLAYKKFFLEEKNEKKLPAKFELLKQKGKDNDVNFLISICKQYQHQEYTIEKEEVIENFKKYCSQKR